MIPNEVEAGRGHECSEFFNQLDWFKDQVGGSVTPAALEAIQQPAVRQYRQALGSQRRTAGMPTKPLQPQAVMSGDADIGVNAEAGNRGTAQPGGDGEILQIDRVAGLCEAPTCTRAEIFTSAGHK